MSAELETIANRMMRAIETNDLATMRELNHDDVRIWHSFDGLVQGKDDNIALLGGIRLLGQASYHILERVCVGERIIQRHELVITTWDESREYRLPAAIFMTVRGGQVVSVEEYCDSRDVGEIVAAMQQAAAALQPATAFPNGAEAV